MIDQITLDMWLAHFRAAESWDDLGYEPSDVAGVLSDMGALRSIVESLAARNLLVAQPDMMGLYRDWQCADCGIHMVSNGDVSGPDYLSDPLVHREQCLYRQAKALIGPASERTEAEL